MNGYKTYIASALLAVFGVLVQVDWVKFLDEPNAAAWVAIGSAALMAIMRAWTQKTTVQAALETPVPKKGK